ncbi:site-specific integrase [Mesonia sediminis]|uniref:Site-specific integrase n=1 Tax=Mesonia sediminis TaxID=1703946 RepID=A0ABW5SE60_9FLAO
MLPKVTTLAWVKKAKPDSLNQVPIYLRITKDRKRVEISLGIKIKLEQWNAKAQKAKGNSIDSRKINNAIDKAKSKIASICEEIERQGEFLTPILVKNKYLGLDVKYETLNQLINYHQQKMKATLKKGTLKNYYTTQRYLNEFVRLKHKSTDVYIKQVNYKFMIDFEDFLREQDGLNNNGLMKHLERLKKLINFAEDLEWIEKNTVKRFKLRFDQVDKGYLTKADLAKLINAEFENDTLEVVKDVFLFACHTGLAYSDLKKLSKNEITLGIDGKKWIYTRRQKTNTSLRIPLLELPLQIIQKYKDHPRVCKTDNLLPVFTNQRMNKYLKQIAEELNIKQALSSHIARHTFATTVTLSNGVPIETVSKLLGHTKLSTTQIYARIVDTKVADDLRCLDSTHKSRKTISR